MIRFGRDSSEEGEHGCEGHCGKEIFGAADRLRTARNAISHSWDSDSLMDFHAKGPIADMHRMEELLIERTELAELFAGGLKPIAAFRIRLIWIVGRIVYETAAYERAKRARLRPRDVLYGKVHPKWLRQVGNIAMETTREIVRLG